MQFEDLIDEHGAIAFEKQESLAAVVEKSSWHLDLDKGELVFDSFSVAIQILGTVSESTNTWLWAWANVESNIPDRLLLAANQIRDLGRQMDVAELTEPEFDVADYANGHHIALVCAGMLDGGAYYRGTYNGGAAFLLLPQFPRQQSSEPLPNLRVISTFTNYISAVECDHRLAFEAYARRKGYVCSGSDRNVIAIRPDQPPLEARFDAKGRLVKLNAQIARASTTRQWWKFWKGSSREA